MNIVSIKQFFSHAFAITDGENEISKEDIALLDKISKFVVQRRLTIPSIMMLETVRPLSFVGSQIMAFFRPTLGIFLNQNEYRRLQKILEKRCSVRLFVERIELMERLRTTPKETT